MHRFWAQGTPAHAAGNSWQIGWTCEPCQYGCVNADTVRSLGRIEVADLLRLAALAADGEAELFRRHPNGSGRYAGRLLGRALCQGAALHYLNGENGVKDFDI
jgi:hypothetical protein